MQKTLHMLKTGKSQIILILLMLAAIPAFSQREVKGRVTASKTGETLPGVNVVVQGTFRGAATDIDGNFALQTQAGDKFLVFTFTG